MTVTLLAGVFITLFGALGAWFLATRFPSARFMRAGYVLMAAGGALFVIWSATKGMAMGIAATIVLAAGGAVGALGALRSELRMPR